MKTASQPKRLGQPPARTGLVALGWWTWGLLFSAVMLGCTAEAEPSESDAALGCTSASDCPAGGACVVPACTQGTCGLLATTGGEPCDEANRCLTGRTCSAGVCEGGSQRVCDDGVPCTSDGCDPATGCWFVATALACDDANPCTNDTCASGGCSHTPTVQPCNDGDPCTVGDACEAGSCVGSADGLCEDNNVCTTDSCDPEAGCVHVWNKAPCDDGDPGTAGDVCTQGLCAGQVP